MSQAPCLSQDPLRVSGPDQVRQAISCRALNKGDSDRLPTRAERCFKDEDLGCLHDTPRYRPDLKPIERLLAYAKGRVARTWSGNRSLREGTEKLREGPRGKRTDDVNDWEHRPANRKGMIDDSMSEANRCVQGDAVLGGRIGSLENVPGRYEVSKESGLDRVEHGEGVDVSEADAGDGG